ncbi:MAG: hypothetical protein KF799_12655 [Bdellovibrionales bacterium]|nr:hypothetical protein [Bdellovibrionales bacterium]
MKRALALVFAIALSLPARADNPQREFLTSCTYGVMAGTLVGVASLAFVSKPGDNLNRVARGASIGLYTGILLGFYVVYIVPGMQSGEEEDPVAMYKSLPFMIAPTFTADNRLDGVHADFTVLRF